MTESVLTPARDVALAPLTTLGVGGAAEWFVAAADADALAAAHEWCRQRQCDLHVLGGGSNVLIADRGLRGLVVRIAIGGREFRGGADATLVRAGAGEDWDRLVADTVGRGLAGLECLSGIPGTVGGTPIQNVGAYGQEVAETMVAVEAFDRRTGQSVVLRGDECGFSYRTSRFKGADAGRFVVSHVTFALRAGEPTVRYPELEAALRGPGGLRPALGDVRDAVLRIRRRKGMVIDPLDSDTRSVGSFFMNPVVTAADRERIASRAGERPPGFDQPDGRVKLAAAWLIERAGFSRGHADGAVGVSSKHPLAIVNRGGARAADVLRLAVTIKRRVADRFGVTLRPEPVALGFESDPDAAYLYESIS